MANNKTSIPLMWWTELEHHELSCLLDSFPLDVNEHVYEDATHLNFVDVSISDFDRFVELIIELLMNRTWMSVLLRYDEDAPYMELVSRRTQDKLLPLFKEYAQNRKEGSSAHAEFKQYAISYSSQAALKKRYQHKALPLSELIKEQISQNPGFDFHMLRSDCIFVFGEAKYRRASTGFSDALKKLCELVEECKHISDCGVLNKFNSEAAKNCYAGNYALAIGFSFSDADKKIPEWKKKLEEIKILAGRSIYIISIRNDGFF